MLAGLPAARGTGLAATFAEGSLSGRAEASGACGQREASVKLPGEFRVPVR